MRFVNRGEGTQVRIEVGGEYQWKLLWNGEEIDIPEQQGINYGFERVSTTTQGKIGTTKVETKQREISFEEELRIIPGMGEKTIKDLMAVFPTRQSLLDAIKRGDKIPVRDDLELKLREKYNK